MQNEKRKLNASNKRRYVCRIIANGVKETCSNWKKALLTLFIIAVVALAGHMWVTSTLPEVRPLVRVCCYAVIYPVALIILLLINGYSRGSIGYYADLVRIGFVNSAGEPPVLLSAHSNQDGVTALTFYSKGLLVSDWMDRLDEIQSTLNISIGRIRQGRDYRTIVVSAAEANTAFGKTIPWDDAYIERNNEAIFILGENAVGEQITINIDAIPMWLIGGSTGSGKTKLAILFALQAIMRGTVVYVIDFKAVDFYELQRRDAHILDKPSEILDILEEIEVRIQQRKQAFQAVEASNYTEYMNKTDDLYCKRIMVIVDEMAMLTDYGTSKEAKQFSSQVVDKLAGIARIGRAFGVHLVICTQRPDANAVPGAIKSNLDGRICGKADTTLSTIIVGDGRANEKIPKDSHGRFLMANGDEDIIFQAFLKE